MRVNKTSFQSEGGEVVLNPADCKKGQAEMNIFKKILKTVAKDTTLDRIATMVHLNRDLHQCGRTYGENMRDYINCFKIPSLGFINMMIASQDSSESQVFSMDLLVNDKMEKQAFQSIIYALIENANVKEKVSTQYVILTKEGVENIVTVMETNDIEDNKLTKECLSVAKT